MAFTREILRDQPADIYEYGSLYFKAMQEVSIHISEAWKLFCDSEFLLCNLFF